MELKRENNVITNPKLRNHVEYYELGTNYYTGMYSLFPKCYSSKIDIIQTITENYGALENCFVLVQDCLTIHTHDLNWQGTSRS